MPKLIQPTEVINKLRMVPLRGFGGALPYKNAIFAVWNLGLDDLVPTQTYVLASVLDEFSKIQACLYRNGCPSYADLRGHGVAFSDGHVLLPPIIEEESCGLIVNDGMHRLFRSLRLENRATVSCLVVRSVDPRYPYYAEPLANGWLDVRIVDDPPQVRKTYRNPNDYKALFRDFNKVFPGVQETRTKHAQISS